MARPEGRTYPSGAPTQNGRFYEAAQQAKAGLRSPERVRVYEKIRTGIWSYNGIFHLVDSWQGRDAQRRVFKFKLVAVEEQYDLSISSSRSGPRRRVIPTAVKLEVWQRDRGQCVVCGATNELHFDHDVPWAKGGSSLVSENVQLLCARHNIAKSDEIV
jgi:hypothetical protein